MISPLRITKASMAFFRTLLAPRDYVVALCPAGHGMPSGWTQCPDCIVLRDEARTQGTEMSHENKSSFVLIDLTTDGERPYLFLESGANTIGVSPENQIVISEAQGVKGRYILNIGKSVELQALDEAGFLLNGESSHRQRMYDYDVIEVLGRKYLFLDCRVETQVNQKVRKC